MTPLIAIRDTPLDLNEALAAVSAADLGGIAIFVGTVRNLNEGRAVTLLEYHAYQSMAEKQMRKIADRIASGFETIRLAALHRTGALKVGDIAVICVAATPHRSDAFLACRQLIDEIKADVPIWKREHGADGPYWVGWQDARCGHTDHPEHQAEHESHQHSSSERKHHSH